MSLVRKVAYFNKDLTAIVTEELDGGVSNQRLYRDIEDIELKLIQGKAGSMTDIDGKNRFYGIYNITFWDSNGTKYELGEHRVIENHPTSDLAGAFRLIYNQF